MIATAVDALERKWLIAAIGCAVAIILAIVAYQTNALRLIKYSATTVLTVNTASVTGVTLPCSPASVGGLVGKVGTTANRFPAQSIVTKVPAPGILNINVTANDASDAISRSNALAADLQTHCTAATANAINIAQSGVALRISTITEALSGIDSAAAASGDAATLQKTADALKMKLVELQAAAANAEADQENSIPIARNEIESTDSVLQELLKRYHADLITFSQLSSEYLDSYSRIRGFARRVQVDRQRVDDRRAQLAQMPLELSKTYVTAQKAVVVADSAVAVAQKQLAMLNEQIAGATRTAGKGNTVQGATRLQSVYGRTFESLKSTQLLQKMDAALYGSTPVRIVDPANSAQKTGRLFALLGSVLLAILLTVLAILIAIAIGLLDRRLLTVPQFVHLYGKPVIATLDPSE